MLQIRFLYDLIQEPYSNHTGTIHKPRSWYYPFSIKDRTINNRKDK